MFNIHSVEIDWGGRPLKLETGKIARQADGAVVATYGETVVLASVVAAKAHSANPNFAFKGKDAFAGTKKSNFQRKAT